MTPKSAGKNLDILYHHRRLNMICNRTDTIYLPEMNPTSVMYKYMQYQEVLWTSLVHSAQFLYESQNLGQRDHRSRRQRRQTDRDTPGIDTSLFHR